MKRSFPGFKTFTIGVLCFIVAVAAVSRTLGSGGNECEDLDCHSFFSPDIIQSPGERPFFLGDRTFYFARTDRKEDVQAVNLEEWAKYYGPAIPKPQLSILVYKLSPEAVADVVESLGGKNVVLSDEARPIHAAFAKYRNKDRVTKSLDYLVLAKRVEPIAMRNADRGWQGNAPDVPVDPVTVQELIDSAENKIPQSDKFIAERYRFQVMRLLYYSSRYSDAQNYFERYKTSFKEESSPKYRFVHLAAGAYYKEKKYGKADYLFSLVFDKFLPLKRASYFSFHPMEDGDWNETLSMAKDAHEREVLWQLLGIYADGVAAIDKIYAMNPKSALLPLLLVREVNKAEHDWTANQDLYRNGFGVGNQPRPDRAVVDPARLARLKSIADSGNTLKPYLWQLGVGHLFALAGDSQPAEMYIARAKRSMPNVSDIQDQARMSLLFARTPRIQSIDHAAEPYLASELEWLHNSMNLRKPETYRAGNLNSWALGYLSEVYRKGSDAVRAVMLTDSVASPLYGTVSGIDMILALKRNPGDAFDRFLVKNYNYSVEDLQELRAIRFLYGGDLMNAAETFKLAGANAERPLQADPFMIHIKDCHGCDLKTPHTKYTKGSFADRMLALSQAAQGPGGAAAQASFANLYSNRELKAQAVFMAAKTEQNRFFNALRDGKGNPPRNYFKMLKDSYSNTQYYQEIISECETFRSYIAR